MVDPCKNRPGTGGDPGESLWRSWGKSVEILGGMVTSRRPGECWESGRVAGDALGDSKWIFSHYIEGTEKGKDFFEGII